MKSLPDLQVLERLLFYYPATGFFLWRPREPESFADAAACKRFATWREWKRAENAAGDLLTIRVPGGTKYPAHRVAYAMGHGVNNVGWVEHLNGDHRDNRLDNLREVDRNGSNTGKPRIPEDPEFFRGCFLYHEDGYLIWKVRPREHFPSAADWKTFNTQKAGYKAGSTRLKRTKIWTPGDEFRESIAITQAGHKRTSFLTARVIWVVVRGVKIPRGHTIDHIDRNSINNRIENLRLATIRQNNTNGAGYNANGSSQFIGVYRDKVNGRKFKARIRNQEGRDRHVLLTHDENDAALARDIAALHYNGDHALLNFPDTTNKPESDLIQMYTSLGANLRIFSDNGHLYPIKLK